jgi:hypothetical protein
MRKLLMLCTGLVATAAWAEGPKPAEAGSFKLIDADGLQKRQASEKVAVFDCNEDEMRTKEGIVPGAQLISSFNHFDPKELPTDKGTPVVFYCANSH